MEGTAQCLARPVRGQCPCEPVRCNPDPEASWTCGGLHLHTAQRCIAGGRRVSTWTSGRDSNTWTSTCKEIAGANKSRDACTLSRSKHGKYTWSTVVRLVNEGAAMARVAGIRRRCMDDQPRRLLESVGAMPRTRDHLVTHKKKTIVGSGRVGPSE